MPAMDMKPKDSPRPARDMKRDMDMDMGNMKVDNKETSTMSDMSEMSSENMNMPGMNSQGMGKHPMWESVFLSALHCGAGCTLADIVGEGIGYVFREHIPEWTTYMQWGFDYILALMFGLIFQYSAIHQMSNLGFGKVIIKALKVDFFSLTSWQVGMYIFMFFIMDSLFPF